jgi:hypothetical protein
MNEEEREWLRRLEAKVDRLLEIFSQAKEGVELTVEEPDRIASAFEDIHARRKRR